MELRGPHWLKFWVWCHCHVWFFRAWNCTFFFLPFLHSFHILIYICFSTFSKLFCFYSCTDPFTTPGCRLYLQRRLHRRLISWTSPRTSIDSTPISVTATIWEWASSGHEAAFSDNSVLKQNLRFFEHDQCDAFHRVRLLHYKSSFSRCKEGKITNVVPRNIYRREEAGREF